MDRVIKDKVARKAFAKDWTTPLMKIFTDEMDGGFRRLAGKNLTLQLTGDWIRCEDCKSVHRPVRTLPHCLDCGSDRVVPLST